MRVGSLLDGESIRPYQAAVYSAYIVAGAQALITGTAPGAVERALGTQFAIAWACLLVVCPVLTLAGAIARTSLPGLWLQVAGDGGASFAGLAYSVAVWQASWSERATFAAWVGVALAVCSAGMCLHTIRQIRAILREAARG
ncbi:hypothetical protein [Skermania piniformis]|uniref:Uncharacterized protein n=1 Tax=Skermania pinensis TaxID=39122 RepID=A0ABX8SCC5_9ACTN|nr:hypothetical protein [Skermania piniformis]QXQ14832.1 hypothetical protein KV203_05475 [Skermania piniformis]